MYYVFLSYDSFLHRMFKIIIDSDCKVYCAGDFDEQDYFRNDKIRVIQK